MISTRQACEMARALEGVSEKDHFGSDAFVANKRMFATVWHDKGTVNLMLSREQQQRFLEIDGEGFVEIDNAWGRAGATTVQLAYVRMGDFTEALRAAWENSAVKRTAPGKGSSGRVARPSGKPAKKPVSRAKKPGTRASARERPTR